MISSPVASSPSSTRSHGSGAGYHPPIAPKPHYVPRSPCEPPPTHSSFSHSPAGDGRPHHPPKLTSERSPSSGSSVTSRAGTATPTYLSTALVPIGDDGQIRDSTRIRSDELEIKLCRPTAQLDMAAHCNHGFVND